MTKTVPSTNDPQQLERTRLGWDGVAEGFDEYLTPQRLPLAEDALQRVGLRPGMRFLDVGAGSGALSLPAARLGAQVLATDISPAMIERLRSRADAEGLGQLEAQVMDGHALDLEDDLFDVAGSQDGVSLFPNLQRGLSEMARVTKPGGRVLIVAFGSLRKAEFLGFVMAALKATVPGFTGLPTDPPPLPFQVADPNTLREEMMAAGLSDVQVHASTWRMEFPSATHLWDTATTSHPIMPPMVADLTDEQKTDIHHVLEGMLRERSGGASTAVLTSEINVGIGVK